MIRFPTTLVFVDDHLEFLEGLKVLLDPMPNPMLFFSDPLEALDYINATDSEQIYPEDFWKVHEESLETDSDTLAILKYSENSRIIKNPKRFRQVSCVVSDFDMLEMDGIELFSKIRNSNFRKILLTGVASHEYGIDAFNKGQINQFIQKDHSFLHQILKPTLQDQEQSFFMNFNFIHRKNKCLMDLLKSFEESKGIVEHYSIDALGSKLLINNSGEQWILGVFNEDTLQSQLLEARDFDAPKKVISLLEKRKKAFCFYPLGGEIPIPEASSWVSHMQPIEYIPQDNVYYSLFKIRGIEGVLDLESYKRML